MFDFGFWELALVLIISLIVLGPERLPIFASQLGSWLKKIKDFANNVKTNIENESRMSDLKKIIDEQKEELSEIKNTIDSDEK
ncbi:MAG: twin-arginine translocase subunit TatB [Gammaproteobacteria bacterium]|jgi:sec-independent protein translocase protein TatB|nr:twin-arginine translocase subunit TatB [Gammaproteobacteria bacterium]MBT7603725.1 twin-arginine translocase subunit TatB [Gammaproteobacteria bacterium]